MPVSMLTSNFLDEGSFKYKGDSYGVDENGSPYRSFTLNMGCLRARVVSDFARWAKDSCAAPKKIGRK